MKTVIFSEQAKTSKLADVQVWFFCKQDAREKGGHNQSMAGPVKFSTQVEMHSTKKWYLSQGPVGQADGLVSSQWSGPRH
jgi:hypothetical protein